ncbi:Longin-like domain-containing protein [Daedaleopsis nitida]|nr:Longin-like domain-containing protein [Daedaleopsis nitida]
MVKIFSLAVVLALPNGSATILSSASNLSSFSLYQRGSVAEFISFFTKTVSERTPQAYRSSIQESLYTAHVYTRGGVEQLSAVLIADQEYLVSPAFFLLTKLLGDFISKKYQDPRQADAIMKVQQELNETKIILVSPSSYRLLYRQRGH